MDWSVVVALVFFVAICSLCVWEYLKGGLFSSKKDDRDTLKLHLHNELLSAMGGLSSHFQSMEGNLRSEFTSQINSMRDGLILWSEVEGRRSIEQLQGISSLTQKVDQIPGKTLGTIQNSVNNTTGKLGELVTFIKLQASYDRFIPVGDLIDFVGIKLPSGDDPGHCHFIEVKTGDRAQLSVEQKKFRDMINEHPELVTFNRIKVEVTK